MDKCERIIDESGNTWKWRKIEEVQKNEEAERDIQKDEDKGKRVKAANEKKKNLKKKSWIVKAKKKQKESWNEQETEEN